MPTASSIVGTLATAGGLVFQGQVDGQFNAYDAMSGRKLWSIDVGNAMTELASRMSRGVKQANGEIAVEAMMDVREVADAVVHMSSLPLSTNIQFITIMATKMPFVGRG